MKNKLIVIDGLDGCGKSTQFELCEKILSEKNIKHRSISFPDYESPSSALVKMYLAGEISPKAEDINAYAASSFYAVDRYVSYKKYWEADYKNGTLILAGRYVTSNAIHQMSKLNFDERDAYLEWLFDYEYNKLGLPEPDSVIFLDMPIEASQKLLSKRYCGNETKKDVHEANIDYMKKCRESAFYAANKLSWKVINCMKDENTIKSIEEINSEIMNEISKVI